jgi:hypothetical protein
MTGRGLKSTVNMLSIAEDEIRTVTVCGCPGGVVVSVLATGPKGCGFEPCQGNGFLRAIKIRSTPSFEWEVKTEVPCRKMLPHAKDLFEVPLGRIE